MQRTSIRRPVFATTLVAATFLAGPAHAASDETAELKAAVAALQERAAVHGADVRDGVGSATVELAGDGAAPPSVAALADAFAPVGDSNR
jgi:hypothetical protein